MNALDAAPAATSERIWTCYLVVVAIIALVVDGGGGNGHAAGKLLALHGVVLAVVAGSAWAARRGPAAARLPRVLLAVVGLPAVFSGLCWLLPGAHPEPYEYTFAAVDRSLFGHDLGTLIDGMPPLAVELLQLCYGTFYFLCIAAALGAGRGRGAAAFDRAVLLLVGGFLCSYLGYLLVPTLGPKVVLAFAHEVEGWWWTDAVRAAIDAGEANPWDCFPSGHTMLTLTSLLVLWRWNRRWFWVLLAPASALIASTMLLRYHWASDVVAGALLAWPVARACDLLADRDGWPPVAQASTK